MTRRIVIFPYKMGSCSAKALQQELQERGHTVIRVKDRNSRYVWRANDLVVNWGNSRTPMNYATLNRPARVGIAASKLDFLQLMSANELGHAVPEWTQDAGVARQWITDGSTVVARTLLRGSGGRGIVVCTTHDDLPRAPLYTRYVKKAAEYRVHVFGGRVIDVQQKRRRAGVEEVDNQIRNFDRGWVFCREDVNPPASVLDVATLVVDSCGLDFGAVDVIYNQHYDKAVVLEINTAPGLEGTTVERYASAIEELL